MSPHRALLAIFVFTSLTAVSLTPDLASAQDFSCHPAREHCVAAARDNYTIYVDTDGSMNADSGRNICCGGGNESWYALVREEIEDFADDNHNDGPCNADSASCQSRGCDGVRLGVGFFGDDSDLDPDSDGFLAYQEVSAGENRRNDVKNAVNGESAGNVGLPGIETLSCPPNGPGQTDTIMCPVNGTLQQSRIFCPPNGGIQVDEIGCPFDGTAQEYRIACPQMAVSRVGHVQPTLVAPFTFYNVLVDGILVSYMTGLSPTVFEIALGLYDDARFNPAITANFTVTLVGTDVRFTRITPGVEFSILNAGCAGCNIGLFPPVTITGLPSTPAPPHDFRFRLNGVWMEYTGGAAENTTSVCNGLAAEVDSAGMDVDASVSGGVLILRSTLPGKPFTVSNVDASMNASAPYGPFTANLPGVPGDPEAAKTFDFDINGTTIEYDHSGSGETALNICNQLITEVNNSGEDVSASLYNAGFNADLKPDYRIRIQSTVNGQNFTISNVDSDLRDFGTVIAGGAGLPGDPGDGYVFDFMLNSSMITATGDPTSSTTSVCADLETSINGSGEPVTVTNYGSYLLITPATVGELFTISAVDTELTHQVVSAGSAGLPGTPGFGHTYSWDVEWWDGTIEPINVPSPAAPTQVSVCQQIQAHLNAMPEFNATLNATQTQVTIAAAPNSGITWTFSNLDPNFGTHTTSLSGDLPNNPPPYNTYDFQIDGMNINWTDDGTPTQAEVCDGVRDRINTVAGGIVNATHNGSTITITGNTAAAFDVTGVDSDLSPHIVVREAGLGPSAFGQLATNINSELNITTRNQNAIAITSRGPEDWADFSLAVDELCAARDDATAPVTTYFIGIELTTTESRLLSILAAAGGSGSCNGGIDPCAVANTTLANSVTMTPLVTCTGVYGANEWSVDDRLRDIKRGMSCTFNLDVPPTYPDGIAPTNTNATRIYTKNWEDECDDDLEIPYNRDYSPWPYFYGLEDCHDDWDYAWDYYLHGWQWGAGNDRRKFTFDSPLCDEIQAGHITEIESHVGCLCANQGDECTAAFETVDPMTGIATPIPCKSPTHGRCDNPGGMDTTTCVPDALTGVTGDCSDDGYCLQTCTVEQLAAMRCATGVYLCDEDTGSETCTAGADNIVPEICNGVDDDCDGLIDNMSNNDPDAFDGFDVQGRDCNGADACICADGWKDISSPDPSDLQAHIDTWTGGCECGEALSTAEPVNMSQEVAPEVTSDPVDDNAFAPAEDTASCAVAGNGRADFLLFALVGLFLLRPRRRAA